MLKAGATALALLSTLGLAGCGRLSAANRLAAAKAALSPRCHYAGKRVLAYMDGHLVAPPGAYLRYGFAVLSQDGHTWFLSAELVRGPQFASQAGDILTWQVAGFPYVAQSAPRSVDARARTESSFPASRLNVLYEGAEVSRSCVDVLRPVRGRLL